MRKIVLYTVVFFCSCNHHQQREINDVNSLRIVKVNRYTSESSDTNLSKSVLKMERVQKILGASRTVIELKQKKIVNMDSIFFSYQSVNNDFLVSDQILKKNDSIFINRKLVRVSSKKYIEFKNKPVLIEKLCYLEKPTTSLVSINLYFNDSLGIVLKRKASFTSYLELFEEENYSILQNQIISDRNFFKFSDPEVQFYRDNPKL